MPEGCVIRPVRDRFALMAPIHDRMPAILAPGAWDSWLGAENTSTEDLKGLLQPAPAEGITAYLVGTGVNRVGAEGLITP